MVPEVAIVHLTPTHCAWHSFTGEDLKYEKTKGERRPSNSPMQGMIADYFKAWRAACSVLALTLTLGLTLYLTMARPWHHAQDITLCAAHDEDMSLVLREVGHMVKPPQALFSPGIAGKVALYRLRRFFGRLRPSGPSNTPAAP